MKHSLLFGFLIRLLIFSAGIAVITGLAIWTLVDTPEQYLYSDHDWESFKFRPTFDPAKGPVLLDAHSHSVHSNGSLTLRQNILYHISLGYNAMVLTDHNTIAGCDEIRRIAREEFAGQIKVFAGVEWTTDRGHFNLVFPPWIDQADYAGLIPEKSFLDRPSDQDILEKFRRIHELGGIVIINHDSWSRKACKNYCPLEKLVEWGADYAEIVNESGYENKVYEYCLKNNLGMVTGTDMHYPGKAYGWTQVAVPEFSEIEIFNALREKKTGVIFHPSGSPYMAVHKDNPAYPFMAAFDGLGRMIMDMYESEHYLQRFLFFYGYLFGGFFLVELARLILLKIRKRPGERSPRA
jgi:hypothetical protein